MADFIETSNTRTSVRELTTPIADAAAFDAIIQDVLANNPFGCVDYIQAGVTHDGVEKNRESYTVKVNYEDTEANRVGSVSAKAPDITAYDAVTLEIMGNTVLSVSMGGTAVHDVENDAFSCQLKCHDPNGETYYVTFSRDSVRISSYQDDAIRTTVETWADGVAALG